MRIGTRKAPPGAIWVAPVLAPANHTDADYVPSVLDDQPDLALAVFFGTWAYVDYDRF